MNNVYTQYWNAGFNVRSILLPEFLDYYGLNVDESKMKDFRAQKLLGSSGYVYTVTTTVDGNSTTTTGSTIDTSGVMWEKKQQHNSLLKSIMMMELRSQSLNTRNAIWQC